MGDRSLAFYITHVNSIISKRLDVRPRYKPYVEKNLHHAHIAKARQAKCRTVTDKEIIEIKELLKNKVKHKVKYKVIFIKVKNLDLV